MKEGLDIITIGDTVLDIFLELDIPDVHLRRPPGEPRELCLTYGAKVPVAARQEMIGGNAANAAIAFARLGLNAAIYTHVGGDDTGERIRNDFRRNGVTADYVLIDRHLPSSCNTVLSVKGERTILSYHIERHYRLPRLRPAGWVYLTSMRQGCEALYEDLVEYLDRTGAKLCFQPGTYQLKTGPAAACELLARSEIIICNREEAEAYLGKKAGTPMGSLLDGLLALGPRMAVVTDGRKGAHASDGEGRWTLGIIEDVERADTTGAGDAFAAGTVAALASGLTLPEALRWGQAESSSVIQHVGAQTGLLHRRQLGRLLAGYPDLQARPSR